jgi:hypothetical protein
MENNLPLMRARNHAVPQWTAAPAQRTNMRKPEKEEFSA